MQILLGIVLLIGAGLFLYARLKGVGQTSEDLQGSASGHKPGGGPRPYSQEMRSVIASIDDPIVGAAVMMAAIANAREPVDAATATVI